MHKGVCLLLALFVCWVNAATIQYNYTAGSTATYNWVDAATWIGGVVPVAGDDVEIFGGYTSTSPQILVIPPGTPQVNSLTISASDITIQITSATLTLTIGSISMQSNGSVITGLQAPGATIIVTSSLSKVAAGPNATFTLSNFNLNFTGSASWEGAATISNVLLNNRGSWTWIMNSNYNLGLSVNNYGPMTMSAGPNLGNTVGTLTFLGTVNLYSDTFSVSINCALQIGDYGDGIFVQYYLNVYATLNIDGSLYPTNNANVSFLTGSSISGLGAIFYLAYTTGSFLYLDIDFSFNNLQIAGFSTVYSNNHALTIAKLDLAGGSIAGQGQVTAQNVTSNNYDRNIAGGSGVYLKGRNMTVTQVWDVRNLPAFYLSQGASIITASTCAVFMDCNANFLAGDSSSVSIQAGGTWTANPNANSSACSVNFGVPLFATGSFNYPATPGAVLPPTFNATAGGQFSGSITAPQTNAGYYSQPANWRVVFGGGPFVITSGATFNGGVTQFTSTCPNNQYTSTNCYLSNLYSWQAASGSGIIVSDRDVTFSFDSDNVVFQNYWAQSGQLAGNYNITVVNGIRDDTNLGGASNWQINKTSVLIQDIFNITQPLLRFVNGGAIVVKAGGILNIANGLNDQANADVPSGVYNFGRTVFNIPQGSTATLAANFFNFGEMDLSTVVSNGANPRGASLTINRKFFPEPSGLIALNAYSVQDTDRIAWNTGGNTCVFNGGLNVNYAYSASPYDYFRVLSTDVTTCTGIFSVTSTNAPAGHTAVMRYDQPTGGPAGSFFYILLCPNTNSTCINSGNRDPVKASTVSTSTSTTTSAPTSATTGTTTQTASTTQGSSTNNPSSTSTPSSTTNNPSSTTQSSATNNPSSTTKSSSTNNPSSTTNPSNSNSNTGSTTTNSAGTPALSLAVILLSAVVSMMTY